MKLPSKPLLVLLLLVFFKQIGNGMVWSVIAIYGQSMGASAAVVGLMISAYGGARLMVNMPAGYASEKFGRRRMMSLGCVATALASLGVVMLPARIDVFFVCLLLMGIASSVLITSALAAVADLGQPGERLHDMSLYQGANVIGTSLGPAMGGLAAGLAGYSMPFFFNGLIALVGIVAFWLMPWPDAKPGEGLRAKPGQLRALAKDGIGVGLMCFAIFYVRTASNWVLMPLIAQTKFNMSLTTIGLVLTSGAVANLCVLFFTVRLAKRFGRVRLIVLSSLLTLVACAVLAFGHHEDFIWLSAILFGFGGGIATPTLTSYVADVAPPGQRGPAMGLLRTMQDLALILGPFVTGLLSDHLGLGFQGGLLGCLVLLSVATIAFRWGARSGF